MNAKSSHLRAAKFGSRNVPTLLTRIENPPSRSHAASTNRAGSPSAIMSARTYCELPPATNACTSGKSAISRSDVTTTAAPAWTNALATPKPMPLLLPVMSAFLPASHMRTLSAAAVRYS